MHDAEWDDPDFEEIEPEDAEAESERDAMVDKAKVEIRNFFDEHREDVYYKRQMQVLFEHDYFHWITDRALTELAAEGIIGEETEPMPVIRHITFYRARTHRYWKRQAEEIKRLVGQFSTPEFTAAIGAQGEQMFDAALPRFGFMPTGTKVRNYRGKEWTKTRHDLDRIFERDGIAYGAEINNTLKYIPSDEFRIKREMCSFLGLKPLFIIRYAPKSYNYEVFKEGGFTLIFKYQLYPHGQKGFADEVKGRLGLPVDAPVRIYDGTVQRFLNWHTRSVQRAAVKEMPKST